MDVHLPGLLTTSSTVRVLCEILFFRFLNFEDLLSLRRVHPSWKKALDEMPHWRQFAHRMSLKWDLLCKTVGNPWKLFMEQKAYEEHVRFNIARGKDGVCMTEVALPGVDEWLGGRIFKTYIACGNVILVGRPVVVLARDDECQTWKRIGDTDTDAFMGSCVVNGRWLVTHTNRASLETPNAENYIMLTDCVTGKRVWQYPSRVGGVQHFLSCGNRFMNHNHVMEVSDNGHATEICCLNLPKKVKAECLFSFGSRVGCFSHEECAAIVLDVMSSEELYRFDLSECRLNADCHLRHSLGSHLSGALSNACFVVESVQNQSAAQIRDNVPFEMCLTLVNFELRSCTRLFRGIPQLGSIDMSQRSWSMSNNCMLLLAGPTVAIKNGREIWKVDPAPKGTFFAVDDSGAVLKVYCDNQKRRHFEVSLPGSVTSAFEVAQLDTPIQNQWCVLAFSQGVAVIGQGNKRVTIVEFGI